MSYHHASVYSAKLEDYVLKIHGQGWCDMYIQLPNLNAMNTWEQCFNQKKPDYLDFRRKTNPSAEESSNVSPNQEQQQEVLKSLDITTHHPHDTNTTIMLESSMSHDHLLRRTSDNISLDEHDFTPAASSSSTAVTKTSSSQQ
jgi:hypothetical protein